jgi:uncharacterized protein
MTIGRLQAIGRSRRSVTLRVVDMSEPNPCLECGICCTHFRISFYWAEADDAPGGFVPAAMTEKLNHHLRCMKGSNDVPRRCSALAGEPGARVSCTIYENRPTPCREFPVYLQDGSPNPKCDELRSTIGLPPLEPLRCVPSRRASAAGHFREKGERTRAADRLDLVRLADEQ